MDSSWFFIFGPALVVLAVVVSFVGLRDERFPKSRAAMVLGLGVFVVLVGATAAFAVWNAKEEPLGAENREAAKEAEETGLKAGNLSPTPAPAPETAEPANSVKLPANCDAAAGAGSSNADGSPDSNFAVTFKITSPADGGLTFSPGCLSAQPGSVTIDYDNPSPVEHSVAIGTATDTFDESELVIDKSTDVTSKLETGVYIFFCTVPGHREAGMQGRLFVK